jgi:hypothetical protein
LRAHLTIKPGFFSATAEVTVELDAGVIVETQSGRLLGTQASGTGRSDHGAGAFCSGTGPAIGEASQTAMKAAIGQIAERFSNSPRVRTVGAATQTQDGNGVGVLAGNSGRAGISPSQVSQRTQSPEPEYGSGKVCTREEQVQARIARQNGYTKGPKCD